MKVIGASTLDQALGPCGTRGRADAAGARHGRADPLVVPRRRPTSAPIRWAAVIALRTLRPRG